MKRKLLCILTVLCMLCSMSPTMVYGLTVGSLSDEAISYDNGSEEMSDENNEVSELSENDQLLSLYLDESLRDRMGNRVWLFASSRDFMPSVSETTDKVYKILKNQVADIANGKQTSTSVSISLSDDLGLTISSEADTVEAAYSDAYAKLELDTDIIISALMVNCPYDLYWYDKTQGFSSGCSYSASYMSEEGPYTVTLEDLTFAFTVAEEYAGFEEYTVDADKIAAIQTSVDTISSVVSEYSGLDDYDKLTAYKDRICELTSYNYEAAENESTPYGNPWQLIWVFDNDPDTNVVCEGYAKAFQYLCDLSDFEGDIYCYSVTGTMYGGTGAGPHMWNIVHMDDGLNYLVDVTNCDEGTIGAPDQLFLVGYTSSDLVNMYSFDCDGDSIVYIYDEETKTIYSISELRICSADSTIVVPIAIDKDIFPDENFRNYVSMNCDTNNDGFLSDEEIKTVTRIDCSSMDIADLTGIEHFSSLEILLCEQNQLTELDVSHNTDLKVLSCFLNQLTELDVSHNIALEELTCSGNSITSLDLSDNTSLILLYCQENNLKELKLSSSLKYIYCYDNQLTELKVSDCLMLENLACYTNHLTDLDFSDNIALKLLDCSGNQLSTLDVSHNTALNYLACTGMYLTELNLSKNNEITYLNCGGNQLTTLDVSNNPALEVLSCPDNLIEELDVTDNPAIISIWCSDNYLSELDVSYHTDIESLNCVNNQLNELNLVGCDNLSFLDCDGNQLSMLDVSDNTALKTLYCGYNNLTTLDISKNKSLLFLYCSNNQLASLDITKNIDLEQLWCPHNQITNLNLSNCIELREVWCHANQIKELDISNNSNIISAVTDGEVTDYGESVQYHYTLEDIDQYLMIDKTTSLYYPGMVHVHTLTEITAKDSTCEDAGHIRHWVCSGCERLFSDELGQNEITKEDIVLPATGHKWDDGKVTTPATCTEAGVRTYTCQNDPGHTRTEAIPATGHNLSKTEAKAATCESEGNIEYWTCSICEKLFKDSEGKTEINKEDTVIAATGHDWDDGKITKEATCTEDGVKTFICQNDPGHTRTETIPAEGHNLSKTEAKAASCENAGNIEYWTCSSCKKLFKDNEGKTEINIEDTVIAATGHKLTKTEAKAESCENAGNIEYWRCSSCEKLFKDSEGKTEINKEDTVIPATGHNLSKTEAKAATCESEGNIEYWTCSTCEKLFKDSEGKTEITLKDTVIPATGHNLVKTEARAATCEGAGNIEYWTCTSCEKLFKDSEGKTEINKEDTVIPAIGHKWSDWKVTKLATEQETGIESRTCKNCGETETRDIPVLTHTHKLTAVSAQDPTCEADGHTKYWICSGCNRLFSDADGKQEITIEDTVIPATGHNLAKTESKAATCEDAGNIEYWTCSSCEKLFKDSEGKTAITKEDTVIPATGHKWDEGKITQSATCTEAGVKTFTCQYDPGHTRTETIPETGHNLSKTEAKAATCESEGNIEFWTCSSCEKLFKDSEGKTEINKEDTVIPATGHKWSEWTVTKPATTTETGIESRTCENCGETETSEIPVKPSENPFSDVKDSDYFFNPVLWAVNHDPQITKGTSDTTFSPSDTCTRGQAVTFLWRACGCEKVTDVENPFTDVKSSDYFYDAVLWAYKNKITTGTTATTFGPNETCNRGQIVTFLWRSQGQPAANASVAFTDVASDAYYYAPVRWALEKGITKGTTDKTFSPNDSCTRGQIVTFLYRAVS